MAKLEMNLRYGNAPASSRLPPGKYFGRLDRAIEYAQHQARLAAEVHMIWWSSYRGPNHAYRVIVHRLPQVKYEACKAVVGPEGHEQ